MKDFIYLIYNVKKPFTLFLLIVLISIATSSSIPLVNMILIDEILTQNRFELIHIIGSAYLILAIINVVLYMAIPRLRTYICEKITFYLRAKLTENLLMREQKLFSSLEKGDLINVYNNDIPEIASLVSVTFRQLIENFLTLVITISVLFYFEYRIAFLALATIPFYILPSLLFKNKVKLSTQYVKEKNSEINSVIHDNLAGLEQIRISNAQNYFNNKSQGIFKSIINLRLKQVFNQTASNATLVIYWISLLLVFWIGGQQVVSGTLTVGTLLALVNYMDRIEWPITSLSQLITNYNSGMVSLERYNQYINEEAINDRRSKLKSTYKIELIDVSFRYSNTNVNTLDSINLSLQKGDKLAIIGESGSGKTTLSNLLMGLYKVSEGKILINNSMLTSFEINSLRDKIAYMPQETHLFEISILENIALKSSKDISHAEVIKAAQMAGADEFIKKLPNGYDSIYGKDFELSTGEKQRIALSRIFFRNPEIVILDEPTSNLDDIRSTNIITEFIKYTGKEKILILITHDLEHLNYFESFIKLRNGKIVERGYANEKN